MAVSEFDSFDPAIYQNLPRLSPNAAALLARNLLARVPKPTTDRVRDAAGRVLAEFEVLENSITKRRALASELTLEQEADLDEFVDGLWIELHARLESWAAFERPGLRVLATTGRGTVDFGRYLDHAEDARKISDMLFGTTGTHFVDRGYREQAAAMGRILAAIDKFDLADKISALVGPEWLPILRDAQARYTEMVRGRGEREQNLGISLRTLAAQLRWRINLYVVHVLSLLDRSKPATLDVVRNALQPIEEFRRSMKVRGDGSDSGEWTFDNPRGFL